jgi:hypothetical protein
MRAVGLRGSVSPQMHVIDQGGRPRRLVSIGDRMRQESAFGSERRTHAMLAQRGGDRRQDAPSRALGTPGPPPGSSRCFSSWSESNGGLGVCPSLPRERGPDSRQWRRFRWRQSAFADHAEAIDDRTRQWNERRDRMTGLDDWTAGMADDAWTASDADGNRISATRTDRCGDEFPRSTAWAVTGRVRA